MAKDASFDIVSQVDLQEVDNGINQAIKEIKTRYDFKGSKTELTFERGEKKIKILTEDDMKLESIKELVQTKLSKRGVSIKSLKYGTAEKAMDGFLRQEGEIIQGIEQDKAKEIVRQIKELKLKVQASIQGEQVRVSAKNIDDLQAVIQHLKAAPPIEQPIQFINYR